MMEIQKSRKMNLTMKLVSLYLDQVVGRLIEEQDKLEQETRIPTTIKMKNQYRERKNDGSKRKC